MSETDKPDYIIVSTDDIETIGEAVRNKLEAGYLPHGPLVLNKWTSHCYYIQPMISAALHAKMNNPLMPVYPQPYNPDFQPATMGG